MRNIFIIICSLLFSLAYSQEKTYTFNVEVSTKVNTTEFIMVGGEMKYNGSDGNLKTFFNDYKILDFFQSYPASKWERTLRYYTVETTNGDLMRTMVTKFPEKYLLFEDLANIRPIILNTYTNDYGNTIPSPLINSGVNFNFSNLDYINVPKAWDYTKGDSSIKIGISDGRINKNDLDLTKMVFLNIYASWYELDLYNPTDPKTYHGGSVAALAAAQGDNAHGMVGVCPNCGLIAGRLGQYNDLLLLQEAGAKVINISWCENTGVAQPLIPSIQEVINELHDRKVTIVAGSGNWSPWQDGFSGLRYCYPASYDNVISVLTVNFLNNFGDDTELWDGYTDNVSLYVKDMISPKVFTNVGGNGPAPTYLAHTANDLVDICAPGYRTLSYGRYVEDGSLEYGGGTSAAAPQVAGTIGLMLTINTCLLPDEVEDVLQLTSKSIEKLKGNEPFIGKSGSGKLEAGDAVEFVFNMKQPTGNAVIDGQDFYRFNFNLNHINNKLTISNQKFRDVCIANFTARNVIEILPGSDFNPNNQGLVDLKIDNTIVVTCASGDRVANNSDDEDIQTENLLASKLYPNPNNGTFDITLAREIKENITIEVYDVFGKIVYKDSKQGATFNVNAPNLSSGMYIVRLSSGEYIETLKFIKQ